MKLLSFLAVLPALALFVPPARSADAFPLQEGDHVVLVGNTLIERAQRHGYWELALTRRFPQRKVTFRNLGWSGDTVFGDARAGFKNAAHGFQQLTKHVRDLKPTVLIIGYGANESFEGAEGLPNFLKGYNTLLDALAPTKARLVLLSPLRQEDLGRPLPDPTAHNKDLRLYADAIRDLAQKRGARFIDLYDLLGDVATPLTDNGLHPTAWGYWRSAFALEHGLGWPEPRWRLEIDGAKAKAVGARIDKLTTGPLRFQVTDDMLPSPVPPTAGAPKTPVALGERILSVKGLVPGSYALTVDGKAVAARERRRLGEWNPDLQRPRVRSGGAPASDHPRQERALFPPLAASERDLSVRVPQGRAGQLGLAEVPQFDPLVAAKEVEIARLRVPVAHAYELKLVER